MNDNIKKADFICDCVKAVLSDGEPHRYREILNYTRLKAKGTRFDGEIEQNNMVQYINALIVKSDSRYERVRHGIYQMKTSQRIAESALDNQFDKLYSMLFKLAVEIAIMQNLIAATQDIDPVSLERLRGECVKEVKRLNGNFSFEDAVYWQKG